MYRHRTCAQIEAEAKGVTWAPKLEELRAEWRRARAHDCETYDGECIGCPSDRHDDQQADQGCCDTCGEFASQRGPWAKLDTLIFQVTGGDMG